MNNKCPRMIVETNKVLSYQKYDINTHKKQDHKQPKQKKDGKEEK